MGKLSKIFVAFYVILFLSGCLSVGSGPLSNSIYVTSGQIRIKHKLPRGFCLDRSANNSTGLQETFVVTNCIEVKNGNKTYYSRRPVDTIVNITFTNSRVPKKVPQQRYLSLIADNMEFKDFLTASSNKKIIFGGKKLSDKFFHVNFQRVSDFGRREFVRKYFFLVDNKMVVMTILSLQSSRKNTYSSFESFIKKII